MAWRYCRDRGRAEEMAQEAFLRAWRGLAQWRRESSFSTWLFALAANVFRSELKRFPTVNLPLEEAPEPAGPAQQHNALSRKSQATMTCGARCSPCPTATANRSSCSTFMRWTCAPRRAPWACRKEP